MTVLIVVPSYKARDHLELCLRSLARHAPGVPVVVVEDHGQDGTVEMVQEAFPDVELLCNEDNRGLIRSRLRGVESRDSEFILFIDSDIEMLEGALEVLMEEMRRDDRLAFVTCNKKSPDGWFQRSHFPLPSLMTSMVAMIPFLRRRQVDSAERTHGEACHPGWISPGHSLVRREAWNDAGGFDTDIFFYGEEIDFAYKLHGKGWKLKFVPHMGFIHHGGVSQASDPERFRAMAWLGQVMIAERHWSSMQAAALRLAFVLRGLVVLAVMSLSGEKTAQIKLALKRMLFEFPIQGNRFVRSDT